jgi:tetratricopeptide (TPR) repeat protein
LLEIAVETGVLGAALFTAILVIILVAGIRASKPSRSWEHLTAAGLVCSMIAVISDNLVSVSLRQPPVGALAWMFMGLLTSSLFRKTPSKSIAVPLGTPKALAIIPVFAWIIFVAFYGRQQIDEIRSDSHLLKGMMATLRQAPGLAVEQYRMAVEAHPQNLFGQFNLALESLKANRAEESLQASAMLQRASRDYPKSHLIRAASLLSLNRPAEALGSIQRELELRNHPEAHHLQSLIYRKLADSAKEQASLENVLQNSIKGNFPYRFDYICDRLTTLGIARKTCDHIRPIYEELIRRFPGEPVARENLAAVYRCLGENEKAEELTSKTRR